MAEKRNEGNVPKQFSLSTPEANKSQTASQEGDAENTKEQEVDGAGHLRRVMLNIPMMSASATREGLVRAGRLAMGQSQRSPEFMNTELCHNSTPSLMNTVPTVSSSPGGPPSVMLNPASVPASHFSEGSRRGSGPGPGPSPSPGRGRSAPGSRHYASHVENPTIPESVYRPYSEIDMRWRSSGPVYEKYKRVFFDPWKRIGGIGGLPGFLENFQNDHIPRVGPRPIRKRLFQTDRYRHPDIPYVFPPPVASGSSLPRSSSARSGTSSRVRGSTHSQPSSSRGPPTAAAGSSSRSRVPVGSAGTGTGTGDTSGSAVNDNDNIDSIMNQRNPKYEDSPLLPDPTNSQEHNMDIYDTIKN